MKILIADDDRATRLRLRTDVAAWGFEPTLASDGVEAWEVFQSGEFPLVISDWKMPGMDGIELLKKIRSHQQAGYVFIILLTAQGDTSRLVEGMEAGADDFVAKPFDRDELKARLMAGQRIVELEQRLADSNSKLSAFTSIASHDLREPLRTITSFLGLLGRDLGENLSQNSREYMDFINDAAGRMQSLIDELLNYSRLETGEPEDFEPVDLQRLVSEQLTMLQTAIEECGGTVHASELPEVYGDPTQLGQLMQNLISNAIKYRGDLPPVVRISAMDSPEGDQWQVAISDNGIGIPAESQSEIFQPFHRLHGKGGRYQGSGVGLATCKRVVEIHGGRIWVESEPDAGSTFYFTVPKPDSGVTG